MMKNPATFTPHMDDLKRRKQKATKSYAERQRRTRINKSLEELKLTVLGPSYQNVKLEHAAILEFSVEYLKILQTQLADAGKQEYSFNLPVFDQCEEQSSENDENTPNKESRKRKLESFNFSSPVEEMENMQKQLPASKRLCYTPLKSEPHLTPISGLCEIPLSSPTPSSRQPVSSRKTELSPRISHSMERKPFKDRTKAMENEVNQIWRPW
ncbi:predicted protein [Nematostella vectensis]|uniref:BHLH domain-containing protein n=1 Tax=Nematostella vectensis TaxID=45351 RepID=A7RYX5_NEMVE|nr:transcription cofactor HES-6 [Nematostella vectensis]EDO43303.1 predicted protein [Nematostella vectensis]|eukprot:XP_001635366.1 predicted protein [Nematostella vectensis]